MAGTLLFISKSKKNTIQFKARTERIRSFIENNYKSYFKNIQYRFLDDQTFLVEFRITDHSKFYESEEGSWLTFEGTVFGLSSTEILDASQLWKLYSENPLDFPNQLDGHFIIKLFNQKTGKYSVFTDFIKNKVNYISENSDFLLFTPYLSLSGIIRKPELDLEAFNEFMWRYYILSNRTILKEVERVQPATEYNFDSKAGKLSSKKFWEWPRQYTNLSFRDSVDKTVQSMRETARLLNKSFEKPCIDFTMGQDSRQVISSFTNQNLSFATAVFGKSDFYEVNAVQNLAQKYNLENHNIQLDPNYVTHIYDHFKKALLLGNCEQPGYLLSRILYMRLQYINWGNVSLNGVDGHFYKNGLWDEQYTMNFYREPKDFNIDMFLKLRALSNNYKDDIFNSEYREIKNNSRPYFASIIEQSINDYRNSPVSIQVDKFDLSHWLNFALSANNTCNSIIPHISPLLLRRNLEFALTVPVQWKFNLSKYQRAIVYTLDPDLASERTDFGGVNMIPKNAITVIPFYFRYFYFQSSRMRKKIKSKLGFRVTTHLQEAWDYLPVYKQLFLQPEIQSVLNFDEMEISALLSKDEWQQYVSDLKSSDNLGLKNLENILKIASVENFIRLAKSIS
ncbi:MAG: hypothetical protein JW956_03850 [Calditrichaceae bacterium]|nr:hypothetical protein [Calditrichaceae bacterium]